MIIKIDFFCWDIEILDIEWDIVSIGEYKMSYKEERELKLWGRICVYIDIMRYR